MRRFVYQVVAAPRFCSRGSVRNINYIKSKIKENLNISISQNEIFSYYLGSEGRLFMSTLLYLEDEFWVGDEFCSLCDFFITNISIVKVNPATISFTRSHTNFTRPWFMTFSNSSFHMPFKVLFVKL